MLQREREALAAAELQRLGEDVAPLVADIGAAWERLDASLIAIQAVIADCAQYFLCWLADAEIVIWSA